MKKYLIVLLSMVISGVSYAQYNMTNNYNQHWNLQGAKMLPSKLGMDFSTVQLNFPLPPDPYIYAGNNIIGIGSLYNLDSTEMARVLKKLKPENNVFGVGYDAEIIGFGFKVNKDDEEFMNFSMGYGIRGGSTIEFGENFLRLIGQGNKQFEGKTVPLGPIAFNAFAAREIRLGWSMPFELSEELIMRGGVNLKYWQSSGSLYMPKTEINLTTASGGKQIGLDGQYLINYTTIDTSDVSPSKRFMKTRGSGVGADLALTVIYHEKFVGSLALNDLGGIKYKKDTRSYTAEGNFQYQGVQINNIFKSPEINTDSALAATFSGVADSNQTYKMPMPHKLVFQGEYIIEAAETNSKERPYNKQVVYLTYIKGFNNMPGASRRSFVAVGYSLALNYVLNVGTNLQIGGYNKFGWGLNTSLRMGPLRFGIGSNSVLTYLISKKSTTGMDFTMNANIAF